MSTLKTTNLQHASAASPAIVLAADGSATAQVSSLNGGPLSGARNRIINGDMRIDQRNAGAAVTGNDGAFAVDRFTILATQTSKFTVQQSTVAPAGFSHSLLATSSSAYSVISTDQFTIQQRIEGFNTADLAFGSASASIITLSFWVRSSLTGTFGGALTNDAYNRSYSFSYVINSANTWEKKTVTITGDTTGTWVGATNGVGLRVSWSLGAGSTYLGTANSWAASSALGATGQVNLVATNGATLYITGIQLEPGTVATPFERRSYGQELALCQRYFESLNGRYVSSAKTGISDYISWTFKVQKRATPTISYANSAFGSQDALTVDVTTVLSSTSAAAVIGNGTTSSAEL